MDKFKIKYVLILTVEENERSELFELFKTSDKWTKKLKNAESLIKTENDEKVL